MFDIDTRQWNDGVVKVDTDLFWFSVLATVEVIATAVDLEVVAADAEVVQIGDRD